MDRVIRVCFFQVFAVAALLSGCDDSEKAWSDVISRCASSRIVNDSWTYLGVTNTAGPGSVWRKDGQGLALRFDPTRHLSADQVAAYEQLGNPSSCVGSKVVSWSFSPEFVLGPEGATIDANLKLDLDRATTTKVSIDRFRVDNIEELSYLVTLEGSSPAYWEDISKDNRYVANTVLWIEGLTAHLDFDTKVGGRLRQKYPDGIPLTVGMSSQWRSDTELEIRLSGGYSFLAARLVPFPAIAGSAKVASPAPPLSSGPPAPPGPPVTATGGPDDVKSPYAELQDTAMALKRAQPVAFEHARVASQSEELPPD